jgi:ribosomal-protein-alanine N-acetyltransferase
MELRTDRLLLRSFRPEDEEGLFLLWNDPQVRQYLWDGQPVAHEVVQEQIALSQQDFRERGFGMFTLLLSPQAGQLIGFCGLRRIDEGEAIEILYGLLPGFWKRGLATEAAQAVLRFGFEHLGLEEILAGADFANAASLRCMQRLGMSDAGERLVGPQRLQARYYRLARRDFAPSPGAWALHPG